MSVGSEVWSVEIVQQECYERVSKKSVKRECQTRVLRKSVFSGPH